MKISISKKLIMRLVADRISDSAYINWVVGEYIRSAKTDKHFIGETLMHENPDKPVAIVSSPLTAILCTMLYLQIFKGAEVPVWVAINADRLNETHILALDGRDCYFYPTAGQHPQWFECIGIYREILGNVAFIHNGLILAHEFLPEVIKEDTDLASIVILPFETSSLFMGYDDLEFYKRMDASLLKTGDLQK